MRFKTDENLPVDVADVLRAGGHDASTVLEEHLGGEADLEIAAICQEEERILVTANKSVVLGLFTHEVTTLKIIGCFMLYAVPYAHLPISRSSKGASIYYFPMFGA